MFARFTSRFSRHSISRKVLGLAAAFALLAALAVGSAAQTPTASAQSWWWNSYPSYSWYYPSYSYYPEYSYPVYPTYTYTAPTYSYYPTYPSYTDSYVAYPEYSYYSNPCSIWGYYC